MGSSGDEERSESHDQSEETAILFQEAYGERIFRQGKPRAVLEVKSPDVLTAIYEARLRGYDRARARAQAKRRWKG